MQQINESKQIVNRLIDDNYEGGNAEVLRMMDLNVLASNLQQIEDRFDDIKDAVAPLKALGKKPGYKLTATAKVE